MIVKLSTGRLAIVGRCGSLIERVELAKTVALSHETDVVVLEPQQLAEAIRNLFLRETTIKDEHKRLTKRAS